MTTPVDVPEGLVPTRVWDLPTRLFHWLLAGCVVGLVVTGKTGGNALEWHMRLGVTVGALLTFRLLWGIAGGRWSRFTSFMYSPAALLRYLRGRPLPHDSFDVGHSPLGSLSVLAMLTVLVLQVSTGLVADDEIATTGPLNRFASAAWVSLATGWHKGWGEWLVFSLVALHVLAIAFYSLRRKRALLRPMLGGDKLLPAGTRPSADRLSTRLLACALAIGCIALWTAIYRLG